MELLTLTIIQSSSGWWTSKVQSSDDELRAVMNVRTLWMFALRNCPGCEPSASFIFAVINFKLTAGSRVWKRRQFLQRLSDNVWFVFDVYEVSERFADHDLSTIITVLDVLLKQVSKSYLKSYDMSSVFKQNTTVPTKNWHTFHASQKKPTKSPNQDRAVVCIDY